MKIEHSTIQDTTMQYTNAMQQAKTTTSFEAIMAQDGTQPAVSSMGNDSLLLLLQETDAYTGYLESIVEHDVLTEAERQYLLTGDIEMMEKKRAVLA